MLIQAEIVPAQVPALAVVTEAAGVKGATVAITASKAMAETMTTLETPHGDRRPLETLVTQVIQDTVVARVAMWVAETMTMTGEAMTMTVAMVAGIVGTEVTENNYKPTGDI